MTIEKIQTPNRTVRHYCHECVGYSDWGNVENCSSSDKNKKSRNYCPFYKYRLGKGKVFAKVFRDFCLQCMCGSSDAIKNCPSTKCLIYPYRFGKNPSMIGRINKTSFVRQK